MPGSYCSSYLNFSVYGFHHSNSALAGPLTEILYTAPPLCKFEKSFVLMFCLALLSLLLPLCKFVKFLEFHVFDFALAVTCRRSSVLLPRSISKKSTAPSHFGTEMPAPNCISPLKVREVSGSRLFSNSAHAVTTRPSGSTLPTLCKFGKSTASDLLSCQGAAPPLPL